MYFKNWICTFKVHAKIKMLQVICIIMSCDNDVISEEPTYMYTRPPIPTLYNWSNYSVSLTHSYHIYTMVLSLN